MSTLKKQPRSISRKRSHTAKKKTSHLQHAATRAKAFLARRPHRSFRLSSRRDYHRSLTLPGYWAFTREVLKALWLHRTLWLVSFLFFGILTLVLVGIGSEENFATLREMIAGAGQELSSGNWSGLEQTGLVIFSALSGGVAPALTQTQQLLSVLIGIALWLTTVWLLRQVLAGNSVRFRDGLYNAGGPLMAMGAVFLVILLQLLPGILGMLMFSSAQTGGLMEGGVEAMLWWIAVALLWLLSAYWIAGSLMALIVVTLPGMYPMEALKISGDMVTGRRLRLLLRVVWLAAITLVFWIAVLLPLVLIDTWLKQIIPAISWLPVIPTVVSLLGVASLMWSAVYVYLLYRKVVDDDSAPA